MSFGFANTAMLLGLIGLAIPVVIHLLSRRRVPTIDWGAMQFLDPGRRARTKMRLAELLLLAGRMLLLGLVALALARPFFNPGEAGADSESTNASGTGTGPRDVVLILDASDSMNRQGGGTTPRDLALQGARTVVEQLRTGDSVAVLLAGDRVRPLTDALSFDRDAVLETLADVPPFRGGSDLPSAIGEGFRILERGRNPSQDVYLFTDQQRHAWRPGEPGRWRLLRELQDRLPSRPKLWAARFEVPTDPEAADGSVGPLELSRGIVAPGGMVQVETTIQNAGPAPLNRSAELLIDGRQVPGTAQAVGPIPAGGQAPLSFRVRLDAQGSHALTVRLTADDADPLPGNDEASRAIEVADALPVLLVDGESSLEPLEGETDFLRIALAPAEDEAPQVISKVIEPDALNAEALEDQRVLVLANVDRLSPGQASAVAEFLSRGGGVLVAPGARLDSDSANTLLYRDGQGWLPARLLAWKGDPRAKVPEARPAPNSFQGPVLGPLGEGDEPALASASLFAYWELEPAPAEPVAAVVGRLDNGDPWMVERPYRSGRVILLAGPIDAEGGTLPVNPDFVPFAHELIFYLADPSRDTEPVRPGEPLWFSIDPAPPAEVKTLPLQTPTGRQVEAVVERSGESAQARAIAEEPGLYRLTLPDPPGGFAYATVLADPREADPTPLDPAEAETLDEGWPLTFLNDPAQLAEVRSTGRAGPRPLWRWLVLAALTGLCLEVWFTRRLAQERAIGPMSPDS